MSKGKLYIFAGIVIAQLLGLWLLRIHWINEGAQRVQVQWDAQVKELQLAAVQREAELLQQVRTKESQLNKSNERITQNHEERQSISNVHTDAAAAANNSLQQSITSAAGHRGLPATGQDSCTCTAAYAEAARAWQLLSQCSTKYTTLAATTDGLANQVIGLQEYAVMCQRGGEE